MATLLCKNRHQIYLTIAQAFDLFDKRPSFLLLQLHFLSNFGSVKKDGIYTLNEQE